MHNPLTLRKTFLLLFLGCATYSLLGGVSFAQDDDDYYTTDVTTNTYPDKYEKLNRVFFNFNMRLDKYFLKPVSTFYNAVVPRPLNLGIDNFYTNLNNIPGVLYDALEGHFYQATADSWRVAINTTAGLAGSIDIANRIGLPNNPQDFGLVLAQWGYQNSNYFVVPFIGSYTIRDTAAFPANYFVHPISWYPAQPAMTNSLVGLYFIDRRASYLRFQSVYDQMALDSYVLMRSLFFQQRNYQIEQNKAIKSSTNHAEKMFSTNVSTSLHASLTDTQEDIYLDE